MSKFRLSYDLQCFLVALVLALKLSNSLEIETQLKWKSICPHTVCPLLGTHPPQRKNSVVFFFCMWKNTATFLLESDFSSAVVNGQSLTCD